MNTDTPLLAPSLFEIFWEKHHAKVTTIALVASLILISFGGLLWWQRSERLAADGLLSAAKDVAGWQHIVNKYPHSGAAANALLLIAGAQARDHHFEESNQTYVFFLKMFPHHPLAISAELGRAYNEDNLGRLEKAIEVLQQAVAIYPKSYAAPEALMMQARFLTRLGKKEEAKRVVQMIVSQYPDSVVSTMFSSQEGGSSSPKISH